MDIHETWRQCFVKWPKRANHTMQTRSTIKHCAIPALWGAPEWFKDSGSKMELRERPHQLRRFRVGICIVTKSRYDMYRSSIHCFHTWYVSSILICLKYQDKQVAVLITGLPKPRFNMCTTLQDSHLVRNGTQSQFGVEWVVFFGHKH